MDFVGTVVPLEFKITLVFLFDLAADQELEPLLVPGRMGMRDEGFLQVSLLFHARVSGSYVFPFRFFFNAGGFHSKFSLTSHYATLPVTLPARKRLHL